MADDALDGREALAERALDIVDPIMHGGHAQGRVDQCVEIDDLTIRRLAYPHVVHVAHAAELLGNGSKLAVDRLDALVRSVTAEQPARLQRFDVGLDLNLKAKLVADCLLELVGDLMGAAEGEIAVDLEIE